MRYDTAGQGLKDEAHLQYFSNGTVASPGLVTASEVSYRQTCRPRANLRLRRGNGPSRRYYLLPWKDNGTAGADACTTTTLLNR